MKSTNPPVAISLPFGAAAIPGRINIIPVPSQEGVGPPGTASYQTGFPNECFLDPDAGGVAPLGADFNGILNAITQSIAWLQAGGQFVHSAMFNTNVGGYPQGSILQRSDLSGGWISVIDQNTNNPDTGGAGWLPYGGSTSPLVIAVSASNITLAALQAASNLIFFTGTLTANVNIILPAWQGAQWLLINQTGASAFTLTVSTAAGTGVTLTEGSNNVYCDRTNIDSDSTSGISDAANDANTYGRHANNWKPVVAVGDDAAGDLIGTYPNPTLAPTGIEAGTYTNPAMNVDAKGRITAIANGSTAPTGAAGGALAGNYPNPGIANTTVTPGIYTNANLIIGPDGRVIAAADGSSSGGVASVNMITGAVVIAPGANTTVTKAGSTITVASDAASSLARPTASISSASGVVTIDLSTATEIYLLTLTENVTGWVFSNPPASGFTAEIEIRVTQGSTVYTCVSPASTGQTAAGPWTVSTTAGQTETLGTSIDNSGTVTLYPAGPQS